MIRPVLADSVKRVEEVRDRMDQSKGTPLLGLFFCMGKLGNELFSLCESRLQDIVG